MLDQLINGCKKGQAAEQRRLFFHFAPTMMTTCRRYAANVAEAEDILQEAFVKVFRAFGQFDGQRGQLEGWIRRIVVNSAIENWRRYHKNMTLVGDEYLNGHAAECDPESLLNEEELLALIAALPPGYRMVFNLYAIEGYAHGEIAAMLGITESASRSQLARARQQLQQAIFSLEKI